MSFKDFPIPDEFPSFPHHTDIKNYLDDYADAFGLLENIEFGNGVVHARRDGDLWAIEDQAGAVREFEVHPEEADLPVHPFEAVLGGSPEENAGALRRLLDGVPGAYRDAVLLNAAAALVVAGKAANLKEGVAMARESIDSGRAKAKVAALAKATAGE